MGPISRSENRNLGLFVLIAFAWSWLFLLPRVLATAGWFALSTWLSFLLGIIAAFGPFIAAFALTYWGEGQEGIKSLWRRGWEYRFQKKWLVPTLLLLPVVTVLTLLLVKLAGQNIDWDAGQPVLTILPFFVLIFFTNAVPEEFGWRGYFLDRLQLRWKALVSSLIVGAIWGLWQLPLHFIAGTIQQAIPIWELVAQTIVLAIAYTWLFNNTSGSILVAMLFHAVNSLSGEVVPYWTSEIGRWIHLTILLLVVGAIVLIWGSKTLVRKTAPVQRSSP
jgi:membrane protease YdiL (CAAX protease family)